VMESISFHRYSMAEFLGCYSFGLASTVCHMLLFMLSESLASIQDTIVQIATTK
jgi:hypothetical protein